MRHLVTIQKVTETRSGADVVETWSTYAEVWARVRPLTGRELEASAQRWPEVDYSIEMRGNSKTGEITPKMRVILKNTRVTPITQKTFNILAVLDQEERGVEIKLICKREGDG